MINVLIYGEDASSYVRLQSAATLFKQGFYMPPLDKARASALEIVIALVSQMNFP